ncbi:hypothetical protein ABI59_13570 [Acidobacteria bacterium Mor1]|nr:hypothetical protein ABI59_13570 [Acidobacteria bacterium Mor1]
MKPILCAALVAALITPALAGGTLVDLEVPGPSLEGNLAGIATERAVSVYLPPSYESQPDRRYPTLYLLHGITDPHTTWTKPWNGNHPGFDTVQALMDAGIAAGHIEEMILVVPDSDKVCHYTDSPVRGGWSRFIAEDLPNFIDARFRTLANAESRGIAGHSMGGHGAIKVAMTNPGRFGAVYGLNPSLLAWGGDLSAENPHVAGLSEIESLDQLGGAHFYVQAIVSIGQCLSPNAESALLTDLPFRTEQGKVVPSQPGHGRWQAQFPSYMVADHVDVLKRLRGLRFDSAFEDEYSHIPITSMEFSRVLEEHGIEHTFEMYNGDHRNRLWGRKGRLYTEVFPYFSQLLVGAK